MGDGGARLREQLQVGEHRRLEEMPEEEFQRHRRLQEADAKAREAGGGRMPRLRRNYGAMEGDPIGRDRTDGTRPADKIERDYAARMAAASRKDEV